MGVNPRRSSVYGLPCFARFRICRGPTRSSSRFPRRAVPAIIEEAERIGPAARWSTRRASGIGGGRGLEQALQDAAAVWLPVCGPNCDGLVSLWSRAALGRRAGGARAGPRRAGLAEWESGGERAGHAAGCGCTRRCRAATRRWSRRPIGSSTSRAAARPLDRCWWSRRATGASARGLGGVRRRGRRRRGAQGRRLEAPPRPLHPEPWPATIASSAR